MTESSIYHTQWPVVGHEWAIDHLVRSLNADRLRHAYLIIGPESIGKTTFARAFAQAVNCLSEETRPCGVCRACTLIAQDAYADVNLIQAEENKLKIEQVRDLVQTLALRPVEGRYRVIILRRFNRATGPAMDALLKTLEEPPPYVLLLLTADNVEGLLATIRSRCQPINLRPAPLTQVRQALETAYQLEPDEAALLAQLSGGRLGWAARVMADESLLAQRAEWLDQLEGALGRTRAGRFALADTLSKDKMGLLAGLDLWQSYWRDVLLMAHHAATPIVNRDRRHALEQIARNIKNEDTYRVLQAIRRTTRYINQNVNSRLALEVLMLDLPLLRLYPAPPG
jgi:DNA polymerase-3 subunit delta'